MASPLTIKVARKLMFFIEKKQKQDKKTKILNRIQCFFEWVTMLSSLGMFLIFFGVVELWSSDRFNNLMAALSIALVGAISLMLLLIVHLLQHDNGDDLHGMSLYFYVVAVACVGFMWTVPIDLGDILRSFAIVVVDMKSKMIIASCFVLIFSLLIFWLYEEVVKLHFSSKTFKY